MMNESDQGSLSRRLVRKMFCWIREITYRQISLILQNQSPEINRPRTTLPPELFAYLKNCLGYQYVPKKLRRPANGILLSERIAWIRIFLIR